METKISFLINSLGSGGAEKIVITLLKQLKKENIDIELICLEQNNFYNPPEDIKITYLSTSKGNESSLKKFIYIPLLAYKLKKHIKKNKILTVQSHLYRSNYVNLFSKIIGSNHKTQVVNHGIVSRYKIKGLLGIINLNLIKYLYPKANNIIFISKAMEKDFNSLFKINTIQNVINNPYDISNIKELSKNKINDFHFNNQKKYIICMGRLIKLKRFDNIIKSLKYLNNNTELIILGEGSEKNNLILLIKKLNLEKRVHLLGNKKNPFKYIAKSDLFILSSETEGFPNSLIEALACNVPVVASDCLSGPREILSPNSNVNDRVIEQIEITPFGILYPTFNIDCLVEAINLILETNIKTDLTKHNRENDFSIEKIIKKYKKVLNIEKDSNSN